MTENEEQHPSPFNPKMHFGPLPSKSSLPTLKKSDLQKLKLRKMYENFLESANFEDLVEALLFEGEHYQEDFPDKVFGMLFECVAFGEENENELGDENENEDEHDDDSPSPLSHSAQLAFFTNLLDYPDIRLNLFKLISKSPIINQNIFQLIFSAMQKLGQSENDLSKVQFLTEKSKSQVLAGQTQKYFSKAWLNLLAKSEENVKEEILNLFLEDLLDKFGEESKNCLDALTKLSNCNADTNPTCSSYLAFSCMIKLLINNDQVQFSKIYEDAFSKLKNATDIFDKNVRIATTFLNTINLILQSTHLPIFMRTKIIRELAILANKSCRSEITSKILSIISFQQRNYSSDKAFLELKYNCEFNYKSKNSFKIGGIQTCFPEVVNLRGHIGGGVFFKIFFEFSKI